MRRAALSTPFLGCVVALLTWPIAGIAPAGGIDPSWVAGLYMEASRGMNAGTEIVFTYGPLGFLHHVNLFDVWLGRLAFVWSGGVHVAVCVALLWAARAAFGLAVGLAVTVLAAALPHTDPVLVVAAVVGCAALFGQWPRRLVLAFAAGAGAMTAIELLASLRAGPTLIAMSLAVLLGLPDRRRTLPVFAGALVAMLVVAWFAVGQGMGNAGAYLLNSASMVGGYSSSMMVRELDSEWQLPAFALAVAAIATLAVAASRGLVMARRVALAVMLAAAVFVAFKHGVVRQGTGNGVILFSELLTIGLAVAWRAQRAIAVACVGVLTGLAVASSWTTLGTSLDLPARADNFGSQLATVAIPGRAEDEQERGREALIAGYGLTPRELRLLRSGTVHVAPWEAAAAWAYDFDWNPLPAFQQYTAYTERLDHLNAEKLESADAPERILWATVPVAQADGSVINVPPTLDGKVPAFESPAQMVAMLCRYDTTRWSQRWAILRRVADRCGSERRLETVEVGNGEPVSLPLTRPDEVLVVRVRGLAVSGTERLRAFLFRAAGRNVVLNGAVGALVGETAADGLLLRVPPAADFPGPFALDPKLGEVAFSRGPGFLTGVGPSTRLALSFSALPIDSASPAG